MTQRSDNGHFVWFDLMTTAPEAAIDFYTAVFDWTTEIWENDEGPYTMWVADGTPLGGVMDLPEEAAEQGAPPNWMAYVVVESVDDTADAVVDASGSVLHPPTDIPEVGRFAVISDPQGAVIAVFTPLSDPEKKAGEAGIGHVSWCELATSNQSAAFDFYSEIFGWEHKEAMNMGEAGVYQIFGLGERQFGGMFTQPEGMDMPPMWLYYVRVANMDEAIELIADNGGEVINGPVQVPDGDMVAQCIDPQGALFAIHCKA